MDDYERVLMVKQECFVYRLPPRPSNKGYRASDWGLDKPQWTVRMRITLKNNKVAVKLENQISGEPFATAPIDTYPGVAVESVTDSSRYFVLRIKDGDRSAFLGVGFADRGDAFDFNVTLQDHFNKEKNIAALPAEDAPKLNLGLKEGQTLNIKIGNSSGRSRTKPKVQSAGGLGFLPPPPGGKVEASKPAVSNQQSDNLPKQQNSNDEWGSFSSASGASSAGGGNDWVTF